MRIKTFSAPDMTEAMARIRADLGDDAIIVSSQKINGGMRVTAAIEETEPENEKAKNEAGREPETTDLAPIKEALAYHKVPEVLAQRIILSAMEEPQKNALKALEFALSKSFLFSHLPDNKLPRTFMLLGAHGAGKTMAAAKMAAKAKMAGFAPGLITTDYAKPAAIDELSNIAKILDARFMKAKDPLTLADKISELKQTCDFIYIDTAGVNPLSKDSMASLSGFANLPDVIKILTVPAGQDVNDAAESANAFATYVPPEYILPTKADAARRLGAVLVSADIADLKFCDLSLSASLVRSLGPLTPLSLARLMLPEEYNSREE